MFRDDFPFVLPVFLLGFFQREILWKRLPDFREDETELAGDYTFNHLIPFNFYTYFLSFIFLIQVFVLVLPISGDGFVLNVFRALGYSLFLGGFAISLISVKQLGDNWTGMFLYRIKKGQKLVTGGIYRHIRHPIYLGVLMEVVGFELVCNSWLVILLGVIEFMLYWIQAKKEEKLLEMKFGEEYTLYRSKTKMFLPYIF